ncbi:MAG: DUF1833 domain-containing protein [Gammaproteobacteria bacterium]|nr:DUF1833 domain-containing protein [Gammaproteobacteria bacterium]MYG65237.1 DUF1833 domain-containing protein [Gammaproteobacteria bacterium]
MKDDAVVIGAPTQNESSLEWADVLVLDGDRIRIRPDAIPGDREGPDGAFLLSAPGLGPLVIPNPDGLAKDDSEFRAWQAENPQAGEDIRQWISAYIALDDDRKRQTKISWEVNIRASSPEWSILTALEITHPLVEIPLRVADAIAAGPDDRIMIEGQAYQPVEFACKLARDSEASPPHAELEMVNVGRQAMEWIEAAEGGYGAEVRIMQLLHHEGAEIQWEMTMDILRIKADSHRINARLGFDMGVGVPAVRVRHDPKTSPLLFRDRHVAPWRPGGDPGDIK